MGKHRQHCNNRQPLAIGVLVVVAAQFVFARQACQEISASEFGGVKDAKQAYEWPPSLNGPDEGNFEVKEDGATVTFQLKGN